MSVFNVISLMGGLAFFLFGMQIMGDGLQRVSGSKLESILERLSSTPLRGVLLGAGVTAVIQASGATTVMVVGFVNSGIMQLRQAVGIIMGANLGTTVTAWILSLTGISGTSFWVQMCKPTSFTPILGFIGIILVMLGKSDKKKDIGTIFLGFMVLMFGMNLMSTSVAPLADSPAFTSLLTKFSNPLIGLLAGAVITAIMQSSSASVGILQAIAITGVLPFSAAVPIIMGQNIGTCVTALISAIGTSVNARRAAFIHLYFNVIGSIVFMILFYIAFALFRFDFMTGMISAPQIAIVHTTFNIVATMILLPFARQLEYLAVRTVKTHEEAPVPAAGGPTVPEVRFLSQPGFAVEHVRTVMHGMMTQVKDNIYDAVKMSVEYSPEIYERMRAREKEINSYEQGISQYIDMLNQADLSRKDAGVVGMILNCTKDLERISDHSLNVANSVKEAAENGEAFSKWGKAEMVVFNAAVIDISTRAFRAFNDRDVELAKTVQPLEEVIDCRRDEMKNRHIARLQAGECSIQAGLHFLDIINDLERVSDYSTNLSGYILHGSDANFDVHRYYKTISDEDRVDYDKYYEEYLTEYRLPEAEDVN